jgi:hypothetical protein
MVEIADLPLLLWASKRLPIGKVPTSGQRFARGTPGSALTRRLLLPVSPRPAPVIAAFLDAEPPSED